MTSKNELTQKRLKDLLHYDSSTGVWTWKIRKHGIRRGQAAGCVKSSNGYRYIVINGKGYISSRLSCLYMTGSLPKFQMDHKNRIKDDDRWDNLREITGTDNLKNRGIQRNNTSGVAGVFWNKVEKGWQATIGVGEQICLGRYKNKTSAAKARYAAEIKYGFTNYNPESSAYLYLKNENLL